MSSHFNDWGGGGGRQAGLVYGWLPLQLDKLGMGVGKIQDPEGSGSQRCVIWWRLPHQLPTSLLQFSPVKVPIICIHRYFCM